MKKCLMTPLIIIVMGICTRPCAAGDVRESILASAANYTYMWWASGLRDQTKAFNIQTNRYAMSFDYGKMQLTHLTPLKKAPTPGQALTMSNKAIFAKSNVSMDCVLHAGGRKFRITAPKRVNTHNCQLIESGRFFQRRCLTELNWTAGAPKLSSELEIAAWPDRLLLLLRITPKADIADGAIEITLRFTDAKTRKFSMRTDNWPAGSEQQLGVILHPTANGFSVTPTNTAPRRPEPIKITAAQTLPRKTALKVAYDPTQGQHYITLRNDQADHTPNGRNNRTERVDVTLNNPTDRPQIARLCFGKKQTLRITGLSAIICDSAARPIGLPVQISKNWHVKTKTERYEGPWYRGLTMLTVPARTTLKIQYVSFGALFGGVPAASHAQLCLVGWGNNQLWEEAALGSWGESLCFEPDQGQRGGAVLDTRPLMVYSMGNKPKRKWGWTHNVGGADFLVYYDPSGAKQYNSRMRTLHRRNCPVLTEATYAGRTHNGNIDLQYTASLYRSDDITRGVYRFRYDVRKPTEFKRLVLFQCGGDNYSYTGEKKLAIGNETGLKRQWDASWGGGVYKTKPQKLTGRIPWVSMHQAVRRQDDQGAWANRGIIIRRWEAKLGGKTAAPWAAERGAKARGRDTSLIDIVPPPGVTKLLSGDYVEAVVEHVVVPQYAKDYYGPNANLRAALAKHADTWRMISREAIGNDLAVKVTQGKLSRLRPTMIIADNNRAEFSITGGLGYAPITISGLSDYKAPKLELIEGDKRRVVTHHQCDYNTESRTWEITYSVPLDSPGDKRITRKFTFSLGASEPQK